MVSIGKDYSKLIIGYEEKLLNLKEHNLLYNDENIRNAIHICLLYTSPSPRDTR